MPSSGLRCKRNRKANFIFCYFYIWIYLSSFYLFVVFLKSFMYLIAVWVLKQTNKLFNCLSIYIFACGYVHVWIFTTFVFYLKSESIISNIIKHFFFKFTPMSIAKEYNIGWAHFRYTLNIKSQFVLRLHVTVAKTNIEKQTDYTIRWMSSTCWFKGFVAL